MFRAGEHARLRRERVSRRSRDRDATAIQRRGAFSLALSLALFGFSLWLSLRLFLTPIG